MVCPCRKLIRLAPGENRTILRGMWKLCRLIFGLIADLFRSRAALEAEVLVLRRQIIVLRRMRPTHLPFATTDRLVLGWVCRLFPTSCDALAIVRGYSMAPCGLSIVLALEVKEPPRSTYYFG